MEAGRRFPSGLPGLGVAGWRGGRARQGEAAHTAPRAQLPTGPPRRGAKSSQRQRRCWPSLPQLAPLKKPLHSLSGRGAREGAVAASALSRLQRVALQTHHRGVPAAPAPSASISWAVCTTPALHLMLRVGQRGLASAGSHTTTMPRVGPPSLLICLCFCPQSARSSRAGVAWESTGRVREISSLFIA